MRFAIVIAVSVIRLFFLKTSIKTRKILKDDENTEENSKRIHLTYILFILFLIEAIIRKPKFDKISFLGLLLDNLFQSLCSIQLSRLLKDIWTVKLMI